MLEYERKDWDLFKFSLLGIVAICLVAFAHTGPEYSQQLNAALNTNVTVKCEDVNIIRIYFKVNDTLVAGNTIKKRGFIEGNQYTVNRSKVKSLFVWAQEINNNTNISCFAVPGDIKIKVVALKIQGLLASVGDLNVTFINGSSVNLSWTPPYTLDNVPITGYYIDDDYSNYSTSNTSFVLSSMDPDPCILTNVSVSPINAVGRGEPAFISFYYEKVPSKTLTVTLISKTNRSVSLNVAINASELCIGEYPNNITFHVLRTDDTVVYSNSISPDINNQTVTGHIPLMLLPDTPTIIINVSLSNKGGKFNNVPSFALGISEPVTNITLSNITCDTFTVTWNSPKCTYILCDMFDYKLNINNVDIPFIVKNTHLNFKEKNVDHLSWNISITAINVLGQRITTNATCFIDHKVPRPALKDTTTFNVSNGTVQYNIPVSVICIGKAPKNATITLRCNETGFVNDSTILAPSGNITESFSLPQDQTCNLTIVFSNDAGDSKPLIELIGETPQDPSNVPMKEEVPWWIPSIVVVISIGLIISFGVATVYLYREARKMILLSNSVINEVLLIHNA